MNPDRHAANNGFAVAADERQAFWFLNTLTINKVGAPGTEGRLSIAGHRVPPGFAPPPHTHQASDEAFLVLDGQLAGFCGDRAWHAGPGSLVFLPCGISHGFRVSQAGPGRLIVIVSLGGSGQFAAAGGEPAADLRLPDPVPPDPGRLTGLAAAHGIQILPSPRS